MEYPAVRSVLIAWNSSIALLTRGSCIIDIFTSRHSGVSSAWVDYINVRDHKPDICSGCGHQYPAKFSECLHEVKITRLKVCWTFCFKDGHSLLMYFRSFGTLLLPL